MNFNIAKIEQIDKDITYVLSKSRKYVEGPITKIEKSLEKRNLRDLIAQWKEIIRKKYGKYVLKGVIQKWADMTELRGKEDVAKFEAKEK